MSEIDFLTLQEALHILWHKWNADVVVDGDHSKQDGSLEFMMMTNYCCLLENVQVTQKVITKSCVNLLLVNSVRWASEFNKAKCWHVTRWLEHNAPLCSNKIKFHRKSPRMLCCYVSLVAEWVANPPFAKASHQHFANIAGLDSSEKSSLLEHWKKCSLW